jgi:hypothetical protein
MDIYMVGTSKAYSTWHGPHWKPTPRLARSAATTAEQQVMGKDPCLEVSFVEL